MVITKICLDAGHGGTDPGAEGPTGLKESHAALHIAKYVRRGFIEVGRLVREPAGEMRDRERRIR